VFCSGCFDEGVLMRGLFRVFDEGFVQGV